MSSYRSVTLNQRNLDRLLRDPNGDTGRFMSRVGGFVTREAKTLAAARLERHTGMGRGRSYEDSFETHTTRTPTGLRTRITNTAPHASYLENGTPPHIIRPRNSSVLVFRNRAGALVFTTMVHHPGTRPYRILEDALRMGLARAR